MENYDSNMIKPVDGLQNIIGTAPTRRREQRRRRQQLDSEKKEQQKKQSNEEFENNILDDSLNIDDAGDSKIDYCA